MRCRCRFFFFRWIFEPLRLGTTIVLLSRREMMVLQLVPSSKVGHSELAMVPELRLLQSSDPTKPPPRGRTTRCRRRRCFPLGRRRRRRRLRCRSLPRWHRWPRSRRCRCHCCRIRARGSSREATRKTWNGTVVLGTHRRSTTPRVNCVSLGRRRQCAQKRGIYCRSRWRPLPGEDPFRMSSIFGAMVRRISKEGWGASWRDALPP